MFQEREYLQYQVELLCLLFVSLVIHILSITTHDIFLYLVSVPFPFTVTSHPRLFLSWKTIYTVNSSLDFLSYLTRCVYQPHPSPLQGPSTSCLHDDGPHKLLIDPSITSILHTRSLLSHHNCGRPII